MRLNREGSGNQTTFGRDLFVIMAELPTTYTREDQPTPHNQEEKSSCGVEAYKEPKVLPCCHTFCKSCLDGIVTESDPQPRTSKCCIKIINS